MELDAVILGELGRLARFRFDFSRGAGDCFEEVAESPFVDQLDIELPSSSRSWAILPRINETRVPIISSADTVDSDMRSRMCCCTWSLWST